MVSDNRAAKSAVMAIEGTVTWAAFNAKQREEAEAAALDQRLLAKFLKGVIPWPLNTIEDKRYCMGALSLNDLQTDINGLSRSFNRVFKRLQISGARWFHEGNSNILIAVPDDQINQLGVQSRTLLDTMKNNAPVR